MEEIVGQMKCENCGAHMVITNKGAECPHCGAKYYVVPSNNIELFGVSFLIDKYVFDKYEEEAAESAKKRMALEISERLVEKIPFEIKEDYVNPNCMKVETIFRYVKGNDK